MTTKLFQLFALCVLPALGIAQQSNPIKMLYQPRENFITFSGAGGGSLYSIFKSAGAASGILALDGNIKLGQDKIKKKLTELQTLGLNLKVNLFNNTALDAFGNFDIRRLVFQDNDFRISLGGRYNFLSQKNERPDERLKTFATGFFDLIIVPYRLENTAVGNKGMTSICLNLGGKFGFLTKWGIGLFGITANPQLDLLFIAEKSGGTTLNELLKKDQTINLSKSYLGIGTKIEIPLNDFALFFDFRKYFSMGGSGTEYLTNVDGKRGLNDVLISVGGMAIGSIFKNKEAKKGKMK